MAMGTPRQRQRQEDLWYRRDLAEAPGHPFYRRLNEVLEQAGFDEFCETRCRKFYHKKLGRPSLAPGMYFRVMLIGFFEGIESERGIAWRVADSLCLRQFLQIGLDERTPDHVTISRTRRLMDEATHQEVFGCVLRQVARVGLLRGKTIGIDATTLEANGAMKSIVRRDTDECYTEYLKRLAESTGGHAHFRLSSRAECRIDTGALNRNPLAKKVRFRPGLLDPTKLSHDTGSMTILENAQGMGATFSSFLNVFFQAKFVAVGGGPGISVPGSVKLENGVEGSGVGAFWVSTLAPGFVQVTGLCGDQDANVHTGCPAGHLDFFPVLIKEKHLGNAKHVVRQAYSGAVPCPPVPEPSTITLLMTGMGGLLGFKRKRRHD